MPPPEAGSRDHAATWSCADLCGLCPMMTTRPRLLLKVMSGSVAVQRPGSGLTCVGSVAIKSHEDAQGQVSHLKSPGWHPRATMHSDLSGLCHYPVPW